MALAFSDDGLWLASGDGSGQVRIWRVSTGYEVGHLAAPSSIIDLAFSPSRRHLAAACGDGNMRIWEMGSGHMQERINLAPAQDSANRVLFLSDSELVLATERGYLLGFLMAN